MLAADVSSVDGSGARSTRSATCNSDTCVRRRRPPSFYTLFIHLRGTERRANHQTRSPILLFDASAAQRESGHHVDRRVRRFQLRAAFLRRLPGRPLSLEPESLRWGMALQVIGCACIMVPRGHGFSFRSTDNSNRGGAALGRAALFHAFADAVLATGVDRAGAAVAGVVSCVEKRDCSAPSPLSSD